MLSPLPVPTYLTITNPRSPSPPFEYEAPPLHLTEYNLILQGENLAAVFAPTSVFHYIPSVIPSAVDL